MESVYMRARALNAEAKQLVRTFTGLLRDLEPCRNCGSRMILCWDELVCSGCGNRRLGDVILENDILEAHRRALLGSGERISAELPLTFQCEIRELMMGGCYSYSGTAPVKAGEQQPDAGCPTMAQVPSSCPSSRATDRCLPETQPKYCAEYDEKTKRCKKDGSAFCAFPMLTW